MKFINVIDRKEKLILTNKQVKTCIDKKYSFHPIFAPNFCINFLPQNSNDSITLCITFVWNAISFMICYFA